MSSECHLKALGREMSPCAPQDHSSVGNRDPQASAGILIGKFLASSRQESKMDSLDRQFGFHDVDQENHKFGLCGPARSWARRKRYAQRCSALRRNGPSQPFGHSKP
jgi:hypothetical protein